MESRLGGLEVIKLRSDKTTYDDLGEVVSLPGSLVLPTHLVVVRDFGEI